MSQSANDAGNSGRDSNVSDVKSLFNSVVSTLKESCGKDVFAIGGKLEPINSSSDSAPGKSPLVVRWESGNEHRKITLPVTADHTSQESFTKLLGDCQPAEFGLGGQNVFDENYRKAGKLDEEKFCTNFNPYEHGIVDTVAQSLGFSDDTSKTCFGIRAEHCTFNIYSAPSGKFKSHVDTPRSADQMGSLVVCFPYTHQGGDLVVRHAGREAVFDWSTDSSSMIQWAAFFSDCEHEVLEVTRGHRLTLTYNLFWTRHGPSMMAKNLDVMNQESLHFYEALKKMVEHPKFLPGGGKLGFTCTHAYPHSSKSSIKDLENTLKGLDMVVFQALSRLIPDVRVIAVIEKDHMSKSGTSSACVAKELVRQIVEDSERYQQLEFPPKYLKYGGDYIFPSQRITWLNYSPGSKAHKELAVAFLSYGNFAIIDAHYSSAVIMAEIKR